MTKNSSKKSTDDEMLLAIQEKARKDLEKLANNSVLLESIRSYMKNLERISKTCDYEKLGERLGWASEQATVISDKIKELGKSFQVALPTAFMNALGNAEFGKFRTEMMAYTPPKEKSVESIESNLTNFIRGVEKKMEEKFNDLYRVIDKNNRSYKMEVVRDRNAYCKFCGHQLMRVKFMIYFGEASMKCPSCEQLVQIPKQLNFKEIN